jgi:hypothetical protein
MGYSGHRARLRLCISDNPSTHSETGPVNRAPDASPTIPVITACARSTSTKHARWTWISSPGMRLRLPETKGLVQELPPCAPRWNRRPTAGARQGPDSCRRVARSSPVRKLDPPDAGSRPRWREALAGRTHPYVLFRAPGPVGPRPRSCCPASQSRCARARLESVYHGGLSAPVPPQEVGLNQPVARNTGR